MLTNKCVCLHIQDETSGILYASVPVREDQCNFMNFLTTTTVSETDLNAYLTSVAPIRVCICV